MIPEFETTFAVPLSCEACIKSVSTSLYKLDGKLGGMSVPTSTTHKTDMNHKESAMSLRISKHNSSR
jgi:copper chaperone CopZ